MNNDILDPPAAHGQPLFEAVLKKQPADFRVFEELDISFSGDGEHVYLQLEKTAMNTDEIVALLQTGFGVSGADVGISGLKDRHSVSTQWFSVRTPADPEQFRDVIAQFDDEQQALWGDSGGYLKSMRLLRHERHSRKLKRGAHRSNQFVITLQDVQSLTTTEGELSDAVEKRTRQIIEQGFPNYIGAQRFGHNRQNLQRARQWFAKPRKRTSRQQRSLWLSAARSALFNEVCAARVRAGNWTRLLPGEPAMLDGSQSFFTSDADDQNISSQPEKSSLDQRLLDFDIHPSAPWWGRGRSPAQGECADFEALLLQPNAPMCEGMERAGLAQERRAIRAIASDLNVIWLNDKCVELSFSLMPGVFATSLLREFCNWNEPSRQSTAFSAGQAQAS